MISATRIRSAAKACLTHLVASVLVAALAAYLVFGLWYPYPYSELVGGRELFVLVVSVDVVSGPLLTLVVFNSLKHRQELLRDLGIVVMLQLAALIYGLYTVAEARPVLLAFEGNRFRTVTVPEVDWEKIADAPEHLRQASLRGPRLIGVRLAQPTDKDFPISIQQSLAGNHPSFRPGRWVDFQQQRADVIAVAAPLAALKSKTPKDAAEIERTVGSLGIAEARLGYVPLVSSRANDWIAIVSLDDAMPKAYLHIDGF